MSKDCHDNTLQESLQKLEQEEEQQQQQKEEEEGSAKDGEKGGGREEEEEQEGGATREDVEEEEEECKTPTSSDHKIPTIQSCPPTPKKKVRVDFHKRKLSELQFFETTRSEELESFFRSNSDPQPPLFTAAAAIEFDHSRSVKRRCRSA